jgi:hypothetical protein
MKWNHVEVVPPAKCEVLCVDKASEVAYHQRPFGVLTGTMQRQRTANIGNENASSVRLQNLDNTERCTFFHCEMKQRLFCTTKLFNGQVWEDTFEP